MTLEIDASGARTLLRTREDLRRTGLSDRAIHERGDARRLRRVRRGRYVEGSAWDALWNEGRHLVEVMAAALNCGDGGPVFWGPSAAVLHRLPLYRLAPRYVHAVIDGARHGRSRAGIVWHNIDIDPADVVVVDGIRCTSLDRTVLDLCRSFREEVGLSAADAAQRRESQIGHLQDTAAADAWRARLQGRAATEHGRGIRQARALIDASDGRAQLPGESVSRLHLQRLGFRDVQLQTHVRGPAGEDYWLDFAFPGARAFGEFDGQTKYRDPLMRCGRSMEDVLLAEKVREDAIRGVTGWRIVRWTSEHIATADALAARLRAFGIPPC